MKTKAEIVQNLLDAHQITAEQAVILLTGDNKEKEYIFIPHPYPYNPYNPLNPFGPVWVTNASPAYCSTNAEPAPAASAYITFRAN